MGDTFGGTWHRPKTTSRGHSLGDVRTRAAYDNQAETGCGALFLVATILTTALAATARAGLRRTDGT